ncbi:MAG: Adenosine deaminase [uncultured Solirubrobacteraceae bacterium]|uniref:Adenosine deaminase n=1 Tax=uncultured Solirubrobacteraceae bacterium TaxID=1162706 RepID=A0A6J4S8S3_9ACTN|nr:MAG: Adenosine deaminase [uncultured Solirubrobacteraceae bacterium]
MIPAVPKAELHVHVEGTAEPELVRRIAARNDLDLPVGLLGDDDRFAWHGFPGFLDTYDLAASVIRTAQDYRDVVFEYLSGCAAEGAIYVELISSPDQARAVGLPEEEHRAGLFAGIDDARAAHGIEGRIVVSVVRNLGVEAAERTAAEAAALPHPYVVGFNMAGDEAGYPPSPFRRAYEIARDAGLGCTVHAGEHAGPESVRQALALPGVTRISHGVRAVEDPGLVRELADAGTVLEVCPTSNVALGVYESYADHPFAALREAGVPVTLGSDDPPFFRATIGGEYAVARKHFGLDDAALLDVTRTAITASFADATLREELLRRLHPGGPAREAARCGPPSPSTLRRPPTDGVR